VGIGREGMGLAVELNGMRCHNSHCHTALVSVESAGERKISAAARVELT
jgi:hypothetical protein